MKRGDIVTGLRLAADMIACGKLLPSEGERGRELALASLPPEFDALQPVFANPETEDQVLVVTLEQIADQLDRSAPPPCEDRPTTKRQRAAAIDAEISAMADELRKNGVRDPVRQAESEIAAKWGHTNGPALNRWLRRNR